MYLMQTKMTKPLLKFKVYVRAKYGPKTPFFWCSVWRTLPQMRAHMKDICNGLVFGTTRFKDGGKYKQSFGACYSWNATDGKDRLLPEMGVIVLAMAYTGSLTIPHECAHAAYRFMERIDKSKHNEQYLEELFCSVVGEMSRQIVCRLASYDRRRANENS
jgi:hypothetical protein